nr:DUF3265 domain-containing protein [Enterovibrio norvegicus]
MIRHAWHFYCALVLVFKVICGSYCKDTLRGQAL